MSVEEYDVFNGLKTERFISNNDTLDLEFENLSMDYIKNTYDEEWNAFLEEDVSAALKHAIQEIDNARKSTTDFDKHMKRACKDLENYLRAANYVINEYEGVTVNIVDCSDMMDMWHRDAKRLIELLASFHDELVDECVTNAISKVYFEARRKNNCLAFCPNYRELYQKIGDDALFRFGDVGRAIEWYNLLVIDWEIYDSLDVELDESELFIKENIQWWKKLLSQLNEVYELTYDDMNHTAIVGLEKTLDMSDKCKIKLGEYLDCWGRYSEGAVDSNPEDIWNCAVAFINAVKEDNNQSNTEDINMLHLRTELLFAWIILDQAKYYHLLTIASDFCSTEGVISNEIVERVDQLLTDGSLELDKTQPIQDYYDQNISLMRGEEGKTLITEILYMLRIVSLCDRILNVLNNGIFSGEVAYYTSQSTLMKMLPGTADYEENVGKFAVMHISYMNDPNEGKIIKKCLRHTEEKDDNGRVKANYPYVFIKCFTTRIDDLPMWEMYGEHAKGCCLVIDMDKVMRSEKKTFPVYNVCYINMLADNTYDILEDDNGSISDEGIDIIKSAIEEIARLKECGGENIKYHDVLDQLLSRIAYLFKNADYSYECEKRIIYTMSSGVDKRIKHTKVKKEEDAPMLYLLSDMRVHIKEIILGPKYEDAPWKLPYLQELLDKMCKEVGDSKPIKITYSSIDYK